jgi:hypothetical protein
MTKPTVPQDPYKASITAKWRQSAQLTSERADALERQNVCLSLQRKLHLYAHLYRGTATAPQVAQAWDTLNELMSSEFDRLQDEINRCDAILDKLTAELRDFMMDGSTL